MMEWVYLGLNLCILTLYLVIGLIMFLDSSPLGGIQFLICTIFIAWYILEGV